MSDIPCNACDDLKTYAPDFVVNGVTDAVCAALQNDQGLNASNGRNNATDLQTAIDCLVGVLVSAIETYDVCDWQDFMKQFLSNNYELLSALICNEKGQWNQIHSINEFLDRICPTIDNIFSLIRGNKPPHHDGYFLQAFLDDLQGGYTPNDGTYDSDKDPTVDNFKPSFRCDILEGAGCDASKKLGRYYVGWHRLVEHYPYSWAWGPKNAITEGTVMGVIPRSAVPESDFPLSMWKSYLRTGKIWQWGILGNTSVNITVRAYVIIDGVEFNKASCETYGENNMVLFWGPLQGDDTTGGINGSITSPVQSYDA